MTREEQKEQRRNQILFTALDLFVKKGYSATKVADIAKEANMSVGLLFHYFESKEKLLETLVIIGLEGTKMPLTMEVKEPLDFFETFLKQLISHMKEQPYSAKMFALMSQAQRSEGIPDYIRKIALQVDTIEQTTKIIKEGQKNGSIREGDALAISNAYWCSIQGIAENYACHPEIPLPEPEWLIDMIKA